MCGIAGIIGRNAAQNGAAVRRMIAALGHRGPDAEGMFVSPCGACVLGHTRLSILDPSDAARQPITAQADQFALTYNGECYNYRELRDHLSARGSDLRSTGDTEVVLRSLVERGLASLPTINGMFALALWNDRERKLLLARDRFGQKPLYYATFGDLFLFASEVRALLASGLVPREADPEAIVGYLSFGAVPQPRTIVRGVTSLAPASSMCVHVDGSRESATYWTPPTDKQSCTPAEFKANFAAAVERHLVSDVPIGVFLSGGIDSTAITMAAARVSSARVKTICVVCPDYPHLSEQKFAKRVADLAKTDHYEIPFTENEQVELIPRALDSMDQPTVDGINTFVVSAAARRAGLKVALSGLGGDELFGGYRSSFTETLQMQRLSRSIGPCRRMAACALGWLPRFATTPSKLADMFTSPGDLLSSYLVRRKLFTSSQAHAMFPGLVDEGWCDGLPASELQSLRELVVNREPTDAIGLLEMTRYMGQQLLRDSDVMGMAHGLEIRVPFLDAELSETALRLDAAVRAPGDVQKHHLVRCLGDWMPEDTASRRKQGFLLPMRYAMLGPLREQITAGLRGLRRLDGVVDIAVVEGSWRDFCRNPDRRGWSQSWSLFVLARYLERLDLHLDAAASTPSAGPTIASTTPRKAPLKASRKAASTASHSPLRTAVTHRAT